VDYAHTTAHPLQVLDSSQPLRVMLAWTDPPASLSASSQLVNDLDLVVNGPNGAVYYGNNSAPGDRTNNVEGVIINNPPVGQYTVHVRGYNVPIGSQPYALAVGGPIANVGQMTLTKTADPPLQIQPGGLITYTLTVDARNLPISGVVLSDTLPANTTFVAASGAYTRSGPGNSVVAWALGGLNAGQTVARTLSVRVLPNTPNSSTISNTAYRVVAADAATINGSPVNVAVHATTAPKQVWLPLVMR
jgi:uncharacterized repeat protein (TIGR01451 family)